MKLGSLKSQVPEFWTISLPHLKLRSGWSMVMVVDGFFTLPNDALTSSDRKNSSWDLVESIAFLHGWSQLESFSKLDFTLSSRLSLYKCFLWQTHEEELSFFWQNVYQIQHIRMLCFFQKLLHLPKRKLWPSARSETEELSLVHLNPRNKQKPMVFPGKSSWFQASEGGLEGFLAVSL